MFLGTRKGVWSILGLRTLDETEGGDRQGNFSGDSEPPKVVVSGSESNYALLAGEDLSQEFPEVLKWIKEYRDGMLKPESQLRKAVKSTMDPEDNKRAAEPSSGDGADSRAGGH